MASEGKPHENGKKPPKRMQEPGGIRLFLSFSKNKQLAEAAFAKHIVSEGDPRGTSRHESRQRQAAIDRFGEVACRTRLYRRHCEAHRTRRVAPWDEAPKPLPFVLFLQVLFFVSFVPLVVNPFFSLSLKCFSLVSSCLVSLFFGDRG